jgi:putative flippase GtrA
MPRKLFATMGRSPSIPLTPRAALARCRSRTALEALRFLAIGAACYGLGLMTLVTLVSRFGVHYLIANLIALAIAYPVGYLLNRNLNFKSRRPVGVEMRRYYLANAATFAASLGSIAVMVQVLHVHYVAANLLATAAQTAANFALAKWWVFHAAAPHPGRS